ncbi:phage major tail protein, TP901-1 family [Rhizobium pusense]|uniref:Phage tail protein n=2 Tax=Bacteria TaxID=2 RepID=A0A9W5AXK7_9HYPH|nr:MULTISPECIES: phage major tail protein, TP901-1 family [Rhizobium/Agrobacterium group]MDH0908406.1 phage major tail protein, TP901-1 family [Agrobacterium pusense]MDH1094238.1 phage major tail protein, TP901-1 family [Agrobacterium pusense]MDH1110820.1 phage major tail protein, TP901-1 family [Agrobacterium pusense]MDH2192176.1 phage major tail protein, TP901-1 family [Agrobacterium pusense]CAD7043673.1 phage major tail protein, TP901-1 family [Rhizobium sp. P007]
MPAQKGRLLLVKFNTTGTTYVTIGGSREVTLTINNEPVDITNSDDSGIRKLLENAGVSSTSIKLQGIYIEDAAATAIRVAANTNVHKRFQVVVPGTAVKTYEGEFMIASFEEAGSYNGSVTYNLTLESAGVVTIT